MNYLKFHYYGSGSDSSCFEYDAFAGVIEYDKNKSEILCIFEGDDSKDVIAQRDAFIQQHGIEAREYRDNPEKYRSLLLRAGLDPFYSRLCYGGRGTIMMF